MNAAISPLTHCDIASAAAVEAATLEVAWSQAELEKFLHNDNALYLVARTHEVVGIASCYFVADECQVMNVAVSQTHRKQGIGSMLLTTLLEHATKKGAVHASLEVACDNTEAINLYQKHGFSTVGRRKKYYGTRDALILTKNLGEHPC